tara:strand:+ start:12184 stop:13173 length:990 start_codon:yes stop_codon:yes gene_type:complete
MKPLFVFLALSVLGISARAEVDAQSDLEKRLNRHPQELAIQLSNAYGQSFNQISYIPALQLVGKYRLAGLTEDQTLATEVRELAEKAPQAKNLGGSVVAGHLIFAELGMKGRVAHAASKIPNHNQMSDGVFMGCPTLAAAGKFDDCLSLLQEMKRLCLREDGIYRHSPLDEAAWGRGNGFPALGLAWALDYVPGDFEGRAEILTSLQDHLAALAKHQDAEGMWHQVIDHPESYAEFTGTCMITYAMLHGLRNGWLDRATYEPIVDRAWNAIKTRIALDGESLTNVCESTGKQKSLEAYFQRRAINGRDQRGGAMALMVSTERALWERDR